MAAAHMVTSHVTDVAMWPSKQSVPPLAFACHLKSKVFTVAAILQSAGLNVVSWSTCGQLGITWSAGLNIAAGHRGVSWS